MTSITLHNDVPCCYPDSVTDVVKQVGSTPTLLAAFRNDDNSGIGITAELARFAFYPSEPSDNTSVIVYLSPLSSVTGGTWTQVQNSVLSVNETSSSFAPIKVAFTEFLGATEAHGNRPATSTFQDVDVSALGLVLRRGEYFGVIAKTVVTGSTVNLRYAFNWTEKE